MAKLSALVPVNLEEEKEKFFFDTKYNPQFRYSEDFDLDAINKNYYLDDFLFESSERIIKQVLKKYETEENYLSETEGDFIDDATVLEQAKIYLKKINLDSKLTIQLTSNSLARSSIINDVLYLRSGRVYRKGGILSTLHHEVGTHYLRTLADRNQPWHNSRRAYNLHPYQETEEGLAVFNSQLASNEKYLWFPALNYWLAYQASRNSFANLYRISARFIDNKERRWRLIMKVKRGQKDTSNTGGYFKNIIYLTGIIKLLDYFKQHDNSGYNNLYIGKVAIEDINELVEKSKYCNYPLAPLNMYAEKSAKDIAHRITAHNKLL